MTVSEISEQEMPREALGELAHTIKEIEQRAQLVTTSQLRCDAETCDVMKQGPIASDLRAAADLIDMLREPLAMLLWCPSCKFRHIDEDVFATKPHHTHACQNCGMVWRPAIVSTIGVQWLPGFKNKP